MIQEPLPIVSSTFFLFPRICTWDSEETDFYLYRSPNPNWSPQVTVKVCSSTRELMYVLVECFAVCQGTYIFYHFIWTHNIIKFGSNELWLLSLDFHFIWYGKNASKIHSLIHNFIYILFATQLIFLAPHRPPQTIKMHSTTFSNLNASLLLQFLVNIQWITFISIVHFVFLNHIYMRGVKWSGDYVTGWMHDK